MKLGTLAYWEDALTNWATQPVVCISKLLSKISIDYKELCQKKTQQTEEEKPEISVLKVEIYVLFILLATTS